MKDFQKEIRVDTQKTGKIKEEAIKILKDEKTIKSICEENKRSIYELPKDPRTMLACIETLAGEDNEINQLYVEYRGKKTSRERGYDYAAEIIYMIEHDLSQREAATIYGISRNTFKDAIERIKTNEQMKKLIDEHTRRHAKGRNCEPISEETKQKQKAELKELKKQYSIKTEQGTGLEFEIPENGQKENKNLSQSTIKRYKATRERLLKIAEKRREICKLERTKTDYSMER